MFACVDISVSTCVPGAYRSRKKESDPSELELWVAESYHVNGWWEPSPGPLEEQPQPILLTAGPSFPLLFRAFQGLCPLTVLPLLLLMLVIYSVLSYYIEIRNLDAI